MGFDSEIGEVFGKIAGISLAGYCVIEHLTRLFIMECLPKKIINPSLVGGYSSLNKNTITC